MFPKPKTLRSDHVKRFNPGISQPRPKQSFLWQAGMFASSLELCLWMCLWACLHFIYMYVCNGACIVFMSVFASSLTLCSCVCLRVHLDCGKGGKLRAPHIGASVHSFWSRLGSSYCKRQFIMLSNWKGCEYMAALLISYQNELPSFDPEFCT